MGWLNPGRWLLIVALCGASVLGVQAWSARLVAQGDTAGYNRAKAEATAAALKLTMDARARETALRTDADIQTREKNHEINRLRSEHAAALERLRNRPERPASTPGDLPATASHGAPAAGCTGAELYRQDGQFLAGESLRAETIRVELRACYAQYERAQRVINDWSDQTESATINRP